MKLLITKSKFQSFAIGIWIFLLSWTASAQFAITNKRSVDVFESNSGTSFAAYRVPFGTPVFTFDDREGKGWIPINFNQKGENVSYLEGFVKKGDFKLISEFTPIPYRYSNPNKMMLQKDDIAIILTQTNFDKSKAILEYDKDNPTVLSQINGKKIFGSDGGMPTKQYGFITVTIGADKIEIPRNELSDLFGPSLEATQAFYDAKKDILYIATSNSDGAGGYEVMWVIEKRKYKSRHVCYGS